MDSLISLVVELCQGGEEEAGAGECSWPHSPRPPLLLQVPCHFSQELGLVPARQPQHSRGRCGTKVHLDAQPHPGIGDQGQGKIVNFDRGDLVPAGAEGKVSGDQNRP